MTFRVSLGLGLLLGTALVVGAQERTKLLNEKATVSGYTNSDVDPYLSRWIPTSTMRSGFVFMNTRVKAGTEVTILAYRYYSKADRSMVAKPDGKRRIKMALARSGDAEGWIPVFRLKKGDAPAGGGITGGIAPPSDLFKKISDATQGLWYSAGEGDDPLTPVRLDSAAKTGAELLTAIGAHKDTSVEVSNNDVVANLINQGLIDEAREYEGEAVAKQWETLRDLLSTLKNVRKFRVADAQLDTNGTLDFNDLGNDSHFIYIIGEDASGATIGIRTYVAWT